MKVSTAAGFEDANKSAAAVGAASSKSFAAAGGAESPRSIDRGSEPRATCSPMMDLRVTRGRNYNLNYKM